MGTVVVRPDGVASGAGVVTVTGAASANVALADQLDTTYIRHNANAPAAYPFVGLTLANPTIPANNDIMAASPGVRAKADGCNVWASLTTNEGSNFYGTPLVNVGTASAITTWDPIASIKDTPYIPSTSPAVYPAKCWTQALANALVINLGDDIVGSSSLRSYLYDAWVTFWYLDRPASTPTNPGTVTTALPTYSASITGASNDWKAHALLTHFAVFDSTTYGAGGFDPATASPVWEQYAESTADYGVALANTVTQEMETPFTASGTYRLYTRTIRNTPYAASDRWGAWSYAQFVVSIDPATAPTVTATKSDTAQRVAIAVTPVAKTGHTAPLVSVERSSDSGTTWEAVRDATDVSGAYGSATTVYDYEAPRATALQYRARITDTYSGVPATSTWATATVTGTIAAIGWNLKVPQSPTLNIIGAAVLKDPDYNRSEDVGVFRPKGRSLPVIVANAMGGADGSLQVLATGAAEWTALEAVLRYQGPVYLESPFGWARWIRITNRTWSETGTGDHPRRIAKADFLEVEAAV